MMELAVSLPFTKASSQFRQSQASCKQSESSEEDAKVTSGKILFSKRISVQPAWMSRISSNQDLFSEGQ